MLNDDEKKLAAIRGVMRAHKDLTLLNGVHHELLKNYTLKRIEEILNDVHGRGG